MYQIRCYLTLASFHASFDENTKPILDYKPDKVMFKTNLEDATHFGAQLANKYEIVDIWTEDNLSCWCMWIGR